MEDLKQYKTEEAIKAAGKMRAEGKRYVMKDGDIRISCLMCEQCSSSKAG